MKFLGDYVLVTKLTGYGALLLASLVVAMALLLAAPASTVEAELGSVSNPGDIPATGTATIVIMDEDIDTSVAAMNRNPDDVAFVIATINPLSDGGAQFVNGNSRSSASINSFCDKDGQYRAESRDNTLTLEVMGTGTTGLIVIDIRLVDGADGLDGDPGDTDTTPVLYKQFEAASVLNVGKPSPAVLSKDADSTLGSTIEIDVQDSSDNQIEGIDVTVVATIGNINALDGHCTTDG